MEQGHVWRLWCVPTSFDPSGTHTQVQMRVLSRSRLAPKGSSGWSVVLHGGQLEGRAMLGNKMKPRRAVCSI